MQDLRHFFSEKHFFETENAPEFLPHQWGSNIQFAGANNFDCSDADIVILGCGECRGDGSFSAYSSGPDNIRKQFYKQYNWHPDIKLYDAGNIREGATVDDTRAALRVVLQELEAAGKTVIVLGGSHDLTLQQYEVFQKSEKVVNVAVVDMLVDLEQKETVDAHSFLMEMFTRVPNFVAHYSHIGFQSYYVNPLMLQTLDKLRFDFFRLGKVREHMEEMEPVLRSSHLLSFDMNAVRYSDAPMNKAGSPNGFTGDEACMLTRYAGMSEHLTSLGIYGYDPDLDKEDMTATLIAQMMWYFVDGFYVRKTEAHITQREEFIEFHVQFTSNDTLFIKSKRTNRWWMQLPGGSFEPCSYSDYLLACNNEIPERWLRTQERNA